MIAALTGLLHSLSAIPVAPLQVLGDSTRVVDHLVAVHQHGDAALFGQLLDLGPLGAPVGHATGLELEPVALERASGMAAGAEKVGPRRAAQEHPPLAVGAARDGAGVVRASLAHGRTRSVSASARPNVRKTMSLRGA